MIHLEISGDGPLVATELARFISELGRQFNPAPPATGQAAQTETPATVIADETVDNAQPAASEQHFPAPAKRGRKPDTPEERAAKKAAREAAKATPAGANPASPAGGESDNTGSAALVSFPAGEPASAPASDGAAASSSAASITEAQMREALNALIEAIGGDPGMVAASAIVKKYGYVRVREIKAEHFAAIAADAAAALRERVQVVPA